VTATKTCTGCGETKTLDGFHKDKSRRDGLTNRCKVCNIAKTAAWQKANPGRSSEHSLRWYYRNLEKAREQRRAYQRDRDPEQRNAARRAWKARNRAKVAAENHARRGSRYDEDSKVVLGQIILDPCSYCGGPAGAVDHITALSAGGASHWSNITGACLVCNHLRAAVHPAPLEIPSLRFVRMSSPLVRASVASRPGLLRFQGCSAFG
jgi:5-methylcytosine-specific restriction endonuclease McrA